MSRFEFILPVEFVRAIERTIGISLVPIERNTREWRTLVEHVARISEELTRERERTIRGAYLATKPARDAYIAYYQSTNYFKLWPALNELEACRFFDRHAIRHLDLGSGPGTAVWSLRGWLEEWHREQSSNLITDSVLTDVRATNLEDARRMESQYRATNVAHNVRYRSLDVNRELPSLSNEVPFDLITMMNALNELPEGGDSRFLSEASELLSEDGAIVIIEPGSRELSRRLLALHDVALDLGLFIAGPCTHQLHCPALTNKDDWCHTELPWTRPDFIRAIDDEVGTLRLSMKASYCVIRKQRNGASDFTPPNFGQLCCDRGTAGRVVSELFKEKGRFRIIVCSEMGRKFFEMNKRDRTSGNGDVANADRYDIVQVEGTKLREHDVSISKDAVFDIRATASGAQIVDK